MLHIIEGSSGSGKSEYIYKKIIEEAMSHPKRQYIFILPEQYTMAVQERLIEIHPKHGLINIDVISFDRLAFNIFAELGGMRKHPMDETGKSLLVRYILSKQKDKLLFYSNSVSNTGLVAEIKSVISEFMQYGIKPAQIGQVADQIEDDERLQVKLKDLGFIYEKFEEYLGEKYIAKEEILDVLSDVIDQSEIVKNSVFIFDAFTGFTPIQYKVIDGIFKSAIDEYVTITCDESTKLNVANPMTKLFFMSSDMYLKLMDLADKNHIEVDKPLFLKHELNPRFCKDGKEVKDLAFIEKHLFRDNEVYKDGPENVKLSVAFQPKDEIEHAVDEIVRLTRFEGYKYSDIALVSADPETYMQLAINILKRNSMPVFEDQKHALTDNSVIDFIRSAIKVLETDFTYESMLRYLRSGLTSLTIDEIDAVDNYCLACGIKGARQWKNPWNKKGKTSFNYDYERLEELRQVIGSPLLAYKDEIKGRGKTVKDHCVALYNFTRAVGLREGIERLAKRFEVSDPAKSEEYLKIFDTLVELLSKINQLLGHETMNIKDFSKILDSGLNDLAIGLIPPSKDCLIVGDIERTRLDRVKVVFFLGLNDGVVPKKNEDHGVLGEADKEVLKENDIALAPGAKEKSFIQRFYLYLIMTKASEKVYLSYSRKNSKGESLLPSYIVKVIRKHFPRLRLTDAFEYKDVRYVKIPKSDLDFADEVYIKPMSENLAKRLYGDSLLVSPTKIELYNQCQCRYFLERGLKLRQRDVFSFNMADFGNVIHEIVRAFSDDFIKGKIKLSDFSDKERRSYVDGQIAALAERAEYSYLDDNARNADIRTRLADMADRTLWALGKQNLEENFVIDEVERPYTLTVEDSLKNKLLTLKGRIDRIDIADDDKGNRYVRVVDYKTSEHNYDIVKNYYGIDLQLMTYLKAAMQIEEAKCRALNNPKNILPAGVYYFNADNPFIDVEEFDEGEEFDSLVEGELLKKLKLKGLTNDRAEVVKILTESQKMADKKIDSNISPVSVKKDGSLKEGGNTLTDEQMNMVTDYTLKKNLDSASQILQGQVKVRPYSYKKKEACEYCPYSGVCGFSPDLGYRYNYLTASNKEEILTKMREGDK